MKPQTEAFLEKSYQLLARAEAMIGVGLNEDAGRTAYLAGYHAAQAFIFDRESRILKSHKGVLSEFGKLVKDDAQFGIELRAFLGRTYQLKAIADYETGSGAEVSLKQATKAIAAAKHFVERLVSAIENDGK